MRTPSATKGRQQSSAGLGQDHKPAGHSSNERRGTGFPTAGPGTLRRHSGGPARRESGVSCPHPGVWRPTIGLVVAGGTYSADRSVRGDSEAREWPTWVAPGGDATQSRPARRTGLPAWGSWQLRPAGRGSRLRRRERSQRAVWRPICWQTTWAMPAFCSVGWEIRKGRMCQGRPTRRHRQIPARSAPLSLWQYCRLTSSRSLLIYRSHIRVISL